MCMCVFGARSVHWEFQLSPPILVFETGSLAEPGAHQLARLVAKQALGFQQRPSTPSCARIIEHS